MTSLSGQATLLTYNTAQFLTGTQPGDNTGGQGPDFGKASPVALLVLILLLIAVAFLVKSMTKHLRRVPASFDRTDTAEPGTAESDAVQPGEPDQEQPSAQSEERAEKDNKAKS